MGDLQVASPIFYKGQRRLAYTAWERGYRLSAQRRQGTRSYSTTSPSRSCSDSTTRPRTVAASRGPGLLHLRLPGP